MKIQHGILDDDQGEPKPQPAVSSTKPSGGDVEKNRLFETLDKEESSGRSYAKLLLGAVVVVLIIGGIVFYFTLPKSGDLVRAPKGAEDAVRSHLLDKQKREADDITFYYCGENSYWARAAVKTRNDMPNPVYKLGTYAATVKGSETVWDISSKPIQSPADDRPCQ